MEVKITALATQALLYRTFNENLMSQEMISYNLSLRKKPYFSRQFQSSWISPFNFFCNDRSSFKKEDGIPTNPVDES